MNRDHIEPLNKATVPTTIMQPMHMGESLYTKYYSNLIEELFNKPKSFYANVNFNPNDYVASIEMEEESQIGKTEFVEPEIVIPHESELKGGCVHKLEPEVIHEESDDHDHEEIENEQAE